MSMHRLTYCRKGIYSCDCAWSKPVKRFLPVSHFAVVLPCPVLAHGVASASAPTVLRQQCLGGLARQGAVAMREAGEHSGMLRSSEARRRSTNGQPDGER